MVRKSTAVDELQVLSERFYFLLVSSDQDGGIFITRNSTLDTGQSQIESDMDMWFGGVTEWLFLHTHRHRHPPTHTHTHSRLLYLTLLLYHYYIHLIPPPRKIAGVVVNSGRRSRLIYIYIYTYVYMYTNENVGTKIMYIIQYVGVCKYELAALVWVLFESAIILEWVIPLKISRAYNVRTG